jgi:hypothetical protein
MRIVTMALIGVAIGLVGYAAGLKTAPVQLRTAVVVHGAVFKQYRHGIHHL